MGLSHSFDQFSDHGDVGVSLDMCFPCRTAIADRLQSVAKHHIIAHPPPDSHTSLIDSLSDTFINAFSRVRKPDARFVEMIEQLERFEEGLGGVERLVGRGKNRVEGELLGQLMSFSGAEATIDLAADYQDMAAAYQGLGYLESGITEPLNRFAAKMLDFSALLKHMVYHRGPH
jgi:sorting nexin-4